MKGFNVYTIIQDSKNRPIAIILKGYYMLYDDIKAIFKTLNIGIPYPFVYGHHKNKLYIQKNIATKYLYKLSSINCNEAMRYINKDSTKVINATIGIFKLKINY